MKANAALLAGAGEREVGLFRSNVMGFMTPAEMSKLEGELQELQRSHEKQRERSKTAYPDGPPGDVGLYGADLELVNLDLSYIWRDVLFEYLRIILRHADDADLFQTERIGGF